MALCVGTVTNVISPSVLPDINMVVDLIGVTNFLEATSGSPPRSSWGTSPTCTVWTGGLIDGSSFSSSCLICGCWVVLLLAGSDLLVLLSIGFIGRANLLFLIVTRLLPSSLNMTLLLGLFSITIPVLSHLVGLEPVWFWIATAEPISRSSRVLVLIVLIVPLVGQGPLSVLLRDGLVLGRLVFVGQAGDEISHLPPKYHLCR